MIAFVSSDSAFFSSLVHLVKLDMLLSNSGAGYIQAFNVEIHINLARVGLFPCSKMYETSNLSNVLVFSFDFIAPQRTSVSCTFLGYNPLLC